MASLPHFNEVIGDGSGAWNDIATIITGGRSPPNTPDQFTGYIPGIEEFRAVAQWDVI
jgi:hypothetical protein